MGPEFNFPVSEISPLWVPVERLPRAVEGVCVTEAATSYTRPGDNEDILEWSHPEDSPQTYVRHPEVPPHVPGGLGKVLVSEAAADLDHGDPVTLFGEPEG
jgi:hypothetical protein